jgi:hypothetical protein
MLFEPPLGPSPTEDGTSVREFGYALAIRSGVAVYGDEASSLRRSLVVAYVASVVSSVYPCASRICD